MEQDLLVELQVISTNQEEGCLATIWMTIVHIQNKTLKEEGCSAGFSHQQRVKMYHQRHIFEAAMFAKIMYRVCSFTKQK